VTTETNSTASLTVRSDLGDDDGDFSASLVGRRRRRVVDERKIRFHRRCSSACSSLGAPGGTKLPGVIRQLCAPICIRRCRVKKENVWLVVVVRLWIRRAAESGQLGTEKCSNHGPPTRGTPKFERGRGGEKVVVLGLGAVGAITPAAERAAPGSRIGPAGRGAGPGARWGSRP